MQNTAIALLESASAYEKAVLECEHLEASEHGGFRWERWRGSGMEDRGPPDVPLIVTPPGAGGGAALTTSRRAASARGSRDDGPPSTWRSSVRVRDTGFRGSRKSVVRLEPPCNGLNGLPAIGKEVNCKSLCLIYVAVKVYRWLIVFSASNSFSYFNQT